MAQLLCHVCLQVIADLVGVPPASRQQPLQPVRRAVTCELCQLPAVLAADRSQQTADVVPHPPPWLDPRESAADPQEKVLKFRWPQPSSKILDHIRTLPAPSGPLA